MRGAAVAWGRCFEDGGAHRPTGHGCRSAANGTVQGDLATVAAGSGRFTTADPNCSVSSLRRCAGLVGSENVGPSRGERRDRSVPSVRGVRRIRRGCCTAGAAPGRPRRSSTGPTSRPCSCFNTSCARCRACACSSSARIAIPTSRARRSAHGGPGRAQPQRALERIALRGLERTAEVRSATSRQRPGESQSSELVDAYPRRDRGQPVLPLRGCELAGGGRQARGLASPTSRCRTGCARRSVDASTGSRQRRMNYSRSRPSSVASSTTTRSRC